MALCGGLTCYTASEHNTSRDRGPDGIITVAICTQAQSERDTWRDAALAAQQHLQDQTGDAELDRAELAEQRRRATAAEAAVQVLRQQAEDQQEQLRKVLTSQRTISIA